MPTDQCTIWPEAFVGEGMYINSSNDAIALNGERAMAEAISMMNAWLTANGHGESAVTYKLRD